MKQHLTNTEAVILGLLVEHGEMYGLEMVKKSEHLKRGTVYVLLSRLEDKKLVRVRTAKPVPGQQGPPRRAYSIKAKGLRVFDEWKQYRTAWLTSVAGFKGLGIT